MPIPGRDRTWDISRRAILGVALVFVLLTFRDTGISWDEPLQGLYGEQVLRFWLSGFEDKSALEFMNMRYYGGLFDAVARIIVGLSPLDTFETRHLLNALVGLAGVLAVGRLARLIGGPLAGLIAVMLLLSTPSWWGHMFANPKDIPFAAAGIWTLYYLARLGCKLPDPPQTLFVKFGVALGLALGVRVGGVLFAAFGVLLLSLWMARGGRPNPATWGRAALSGAIAYALMIVFWPAALVEPIAAPMEALSQTAQFSAYTKPIEVLFFGELLDAKNLPWAYAPLYLAVKLPLVVSISAVLGLGVLTLRVVKDGKDARTLFAAGAVLLGALFPVVYAMAAKPLLYDAIRHLLFVLPPLAVAGGVGLAAVLNREWLTLPWAAEGLGILVAAGVALPVYAMVKLHPYQYVYYSELVGGTPSAEGRFEMDYWALSYREATEAMLSVIQPPQRVSVCGPSSSVYYFLPEGYTLAKEGEAADVRIRLTGYECGEAQGPAIATVERMGVELSSVEKLK